MKRKATSVAALNIAELSIVVSTTCVTRLANANITLVAVGNMSWDEFNPTLSAIAGIGPKFMAQLRLFKLAVVKELNLITADDVNDARQSFTADFVKSVLTRPEAQPEMVEIHNEWFTNKALDQQIANVLNQFVGKELTQSIIGSIAKQMPRYWDILAKCNAHDTKRWYFSLISTILNGLVQADVIEEEIELATKYVAGIKRFYDRPSLKFSGIAAKVLLGTRGVSTKPGALPIKEVRPKEGGKVVKFNKDQKWYYRAVASQPVRLVEITEEWFKEYGKGEKWYTTESGNFGSAMKQVALDEHWTMYEALAGEAQHLSMKPDPRWRSDYVFSNVMLSPQGKGGKYLWEAEHAMVIHKKGVELLYKLAITLATGTRCSQSAAVARWENEKDVIMAELDSDNESYLPKRLYNQRLAQAIRDYKTKTPSRFLALIDFTNMGIISVGLEFQDALTMKNGNLNNDVPVDSHETMVDMTGAERDEAKKLGQGVNHGQDASTLSKRLKEDYGIEMTPEEVEAAMEESFGKAYNNIARIASYTRDLHSNENPALFFGAIDDWLCQSVAHLKHVPISAYGLKMNEPKGYRTLKLTSSMPYFVTATGEKPYANNNKDHVKGEQRLAETKDSGGHANIAHSIDAWIMRVLISAAIRKYGETLGGIQVKDNYGYQPNVLVDCIIPEARVAFQTIRDVRPYGKAVEEMRDNMYVRSDLKGTRPKALQLHYGTDELVLSVENNFFSA